MADDSDESLELDLNYDSSDFKVDSLQISSQGETTTTTEFSAISKMTVVSSPRISTSSFAYPVESAARERVGASRIVIDSQTATTIDSGTVVDAEDISRTICPSRLSLDMEDGKTNSGLSSRLRKHSPPNV